MISRRFFVSGATSVVLAAALSPSSVNAKTPNGQVFLIRGFANIFSTGLDTLGKELKALGIRAEVLPLQERNRFAKRIADSYRQSRQGRPIILIGHSLGADETYAVARELQKSKIPVALVVSFDPTGKGPVPGNVKHAINFYTGGEAIWSPVTPAADFKGKLQNVNLRTGEDAIQGVGHFNVEKNKHLHDRTIREIKSVLRIR